MATEALTKTAPAKPLVNKPLPSEPSPTVNWVEVADEYLTSHGWEKLGSNEFGVGLWADPIGSLQRAEPTTVVELPAAGGGIETIRQMTGPPVPWNYATADAMRIQRQRDEGKMVNPSPLERLERLEGIYNQLTTDYRSLAHAMDRALHLPTPTKPENLGAYKNILIEALGAVRTATKQPNG